MGRSSSVYIIAEVGVNHNGSVDLAKELIRVAAGAGANAVKFQAFKAGSLVSRTAGKAAYQRKTTDGDESQYDMLKRLELDLSAYQDLARECEFNGIEFLSTPFDVDCLGVLLNSCCMQKIKISSGEITNAPFLLDLARQGKPILLSTGMSTLGEIERALGVLAFGYLADKCPPSLDNFMIAYASDKGQAALRENVTLLHCTSEYPAPYHEVNLKCIQTLKNAFKLSVGFSDHTEGIAVALAAVACGAAVIEKHFTLDKRLAGPDHVASLEPKELAALVAGIRAVEQALGSGIKVPTASEVNNKEIIRRSIVAGCTIEKGITFSADNLAVRRSGKGLSPFHYWDLIGKIAQDMYSEDQPVRIL